MTNPTEAMREAFEKEYGDDAWGHQKYANVQHNFTVGYKAAQSANRTIEGAREALVFAQTIVHCQHGHKYAAAQGVCPHCVAKASPMCAREI